MCFGFGIYSDISRDAETRFDISSYELDRSLRQRKKKKVIRLMKNELGAKMMMELVGLRPKTYIYLSSSLNYVPSALSLLTCLRALCAFMPSRFTRFNAFGPYVLSRLTRLRALCTLIFTHLITCLIYAPYLRALFTRLNYTPYLCALLSAFKEIKTTIKGNFKMF